MVLRRCAWHPQYYGYRTVYGVASWAGLDVSFSDGLCRRCAVILGNELATGWHSRASLRWWRVPGLAPELSPVAIGLLILVAVGVGVRPREQGVAPAVARQEAPILMAGVPASPPRARASRPVVEAVERIFTPKADVTVTEAASPATTPAVERERPPALAYTPWVARPRLVSTPETPAPAPFEPSAPPPRALLALYTDPAAPRALFSVQTP